MQNKRCGCENFAFSVETADQKPNVCPQVIWPTNRFDIYQDPCHSAEVRSNERKYHFMVYDISSLVNLTNTQQLTYLV